MAGTKRQYRIIKTGNGKIKLDPSKLHKIVGDTEDEISGGTSNLVRDYRSELEDDGYIYAGYTRNYTPTITRVKDSILETAQGVLNLEVDWNNRLTLTYI